MHYKQSRFNIVIGETEEKEQILYNTFTTAMVTIDKELGSIINNSRINLNNLDQASIDNINAMIEMGLIVDENFDELVNLQMLGSKEKYRNDKELQITIAPTMECNMKCPYCFQSEEIKSGMMSFEICDKIVDFIKSKIENRPILTVCWFGGEPLLAMDQITYISKKLIELCRNKNVIYSASIITNGYYLTKENSKLLKEKCDITSAQVTIDGLAEQHNNKRILKNGGKSFDKIVENIKNSYSYFDISVRVNVDSDNRDNLSNLIDYLLIKQKLKGKIQLGFAPVFEYDDRVDSNYSNFCSKTAYGEETIKSLKHFLKVDNLDGIHTPAFQPSVVSCSANVYDTYIFDPDGDIFKCFLTIGKKKYSIGNVYAHIQNSEFVNNLEHKRWLDATFAEQCENCKYIPICQSGCLYNRLENNRTHICLESKDIIPELLMESYKHYTSDEV